MFVHATTTWLLCCVMLTMVKFVGKQYTFPIHLEYCGKIISETGLCKVGSNGPCFFLVHVAMQHLWDKESLMARFMGPTWGPSGAEGTQVGPMLVPWTLLSGSVWYGFGFTLCVLNCVGEKLIWLRSWRLAFHVTWFCYHLMAKPGNKTGAPSWPEPYALLWSTPWTHHAAYIIITVADSLATNSHR